MGSKQIDKVSENIREPCTYVGRKPRRIHPKRVFDPEHPKIKQDVLKLIGLYLQREGYSSTAFTLQDEASVKLEEYYSKHSQIKRIRQSILDGEWETVRKLATKHLIRRNQRNFLYEIYRQEYLELVDRQEYQRAFIYLTKRLKPMEAFSKLQGSEYEFHDLCYLLTCRSVQDAKSFVNWGGVSASREQLADHFEAMLMVDYQNLGQSFDFAMQPSNNRLTTLLQQAMAYQMEFSPYHAALEPKVETLLQDFRCRVVPNAQHRCFTGHTGNVKCVEYLGEEGNLFASGSSDRTICIWNLQNEKKTKSKSVVDNDDPQEELRSCDPEAILFGHTSRIWDLSSHKTGRWLASASGDGTVRLWDLNPDTPKSERTDRSNGFSSSQAQSFGIPQRNYDSPSHDYHQNSEFIKSAQDFHPMVSELQCETMNCGHNGDVYSVQFHHNQNVIASAGYDKTVRLVDVQTGSLVKAFYGHTAGVTHAVFNPLGNLLVTGSKDSTIKFWDVLSGVCIKTISQLLGEVTAVEVSSNGSQLLSGSKDSSNRLWDMRTCKSIMRFKGHQNTSRNFIRTGFGPRDELVIGGSEDGRVYVWDTMTGKLLERLQGHVGSVFQTVWNDHQSLILSCSDDTTVRTWYQHHQ